MTRKSSARIDPQVTNGAALARRQSTQWQLLTLRSSCPSWYLNSPQRHPPKIVLFVRSVMESRYSTVKKKREQQPIEPNPPSSSSFVLVCISSGTSESPAACFLPFSRHLFHPGKNLDPQPRTKDDEDEGDRDMTLYRYKPSAGLNFFGPLGPQNPLSFPGATFSKCPICGTGKAPVKSILAFFFRHGTGG